MFLVLQFLFLCSPLFFFFFKQKTAYEIMPSLVGSEMCIRDRLSRMAERVTFVLIPPLLLIFLVLGTIFLGVATPTEGGAMGAMGACIMAMSRGRLSMKLLKQALTSTAKLSSFVLFILIGSTVFSLVFQGVDGSKWVEHLLTAVPGGN